MAMGERQRALVVFARDIVLVSHPPSPSQRPSSDVLAAHARHERTGVAVEVSKWQKLQARVVVTSLTSRLPSALSDWSNHLHTHAQRLSPGQRGNVTTCPSCSTRARRRGPVSFWKKERASRRTSGVCCMPAYRTACRPPTTPTSSKSLQGIIV